MRYTATYLEIDIIVAGGVALAAIALALLWRQHRLRRVLAELHQRLGMERGSRELAEQALVQTRQQIHRLNASQQSLRDAERRRIARDLHDDMGQHLLALTFEVARLAIRHPQLAEPLAQVEARLHSATRSLRTIVRDLPPEALEDGLQGAVQQQMEQFSRLSGIPCRLEAEPAAFAAQTCYGAVMDAVVYRVLQESLSNIARHAQASEVCIGLCRGADSLSLTVRDNGIGLPDPPARSGLGLRGIAQRVAEAGGRLDISSEPGHGTALIMSFPIQ
jgi:signal transduction histidine kinase